MIDKGTYRAVPVDAALGKTGTGNEQIVVMFELADQSGRRIGWYGYFTDKTFDRTVESLRHLGWTGDNLADFTAGLPADANQEVEIVIDHEPDQEGNDRARVRWINSGRGVAVKDRLDEDQARAFGAQMRGRIAAMQGRRPSPPKPAPPKAAAHASVVRPPLSNDVPF